MPNELDSEFAKVRAFIEAKDFDSALCALLKFLQSLCSDHRLMGRVFGSLELDRLCAQIGKLCSQAQCSTSDDPVDLLFVASNLYQTGGHTALLEDYIRAFPEKSCRILLTDPLNSADRDSILKRLSKVCADLRFSPKTASSASKLSWLIEEIRSSQASWTLFMQHPDDVIATCAMQKPPCKQIAFVHHFDHSFTLGLYSHVDLHIDFRLAGIENCRKKLGIAKTFLVPLSSQDYGIQDQLKPPEDKGTFVTCTSGNNKFEFPYSFQLADCLPEWLHATGGTHVHIGSLSSNYRKLIEESLKAKSIDTARLKIIPSVDNLWKTLLQENVDFYIDSFPVCGCRALLEAQGAGLPAAVHHNYRHPLLSNESFVYVGAFIWSEAKELVEYLTQLGTERTGSQRLRQERLISRQHYLDNFSPANLANKLHTALFSELPAIPCAQEKRAKSEENEAPDQATDNSTYKLDALRAHCDSYGIFTDSLDHALNKNTRNLIAVAAAMEISDEAVRSLLEKLASPSVLKRYLSLQTELEESSRVFNLINAVYPLIDNDSLNREKLSRMLYSLSLLESEAHSKKISKNTRLKQWLKLLFRH